MQCPPITSRLKFEWIPARRGAVPSRQKLMLVLHGRGDSLRSFRDINQELQIPEMNYLLLNAPRRYAGGHTWYAFKPNQAHGIQKSRGYLLDLLDQLFLSGWRPEDIFLYGFSQGALMGIDVALEAPYRLAGVIGISGYVYFFPNSPRVLQKRANRTPILMTHGIFDEDLPISESRQHAKKLQESGVDLIWREFNKEHDIDMQKETPFIRHWLRYQLRASAGPSSSRAGAKTKATNSRQSQRFAPAEVL